MFNKEIGECMYTRSYFHFKKINETSKIAYMRGNWVGIYFKEKENFLKFSYKNMESNKVILIFEPPFS